MSMNRPTVLIISSDPAFSREITAKWPRGCAPYLETPEFIMLDACPSKNFSEADYDLAILDASTRENFGKTNNGSASGNRRSGKIEKNVARGKSKNSQAQNQPHTPDALKICNQKTDQLKMLLAAAGKPAIVVNAISMVDLYAIRANLIDLRREPSIWPVITGLLGREILRRRQAEFRSQSSEQTSSGAHADATLGRFMLEMRTNVNNALTTMLGNAELLTHESGLSAEVRAQADTIWDMALRLHEIFQRFSSLEKELAISTRVPGAKVRSSSAGAN
jgi:hypothetical protein